MHLWSTESARNAQEMGAGSVPYATVMGAECATTSVGNSVTVVAVQVTCRKMTTVVSTSGIFRRSSYERREYSTSKNVQPG